MADGAVVLVEWWRPAQLHRGGVEPHDEWFARRGGNVLDGQAEGRLGRLLSIHQAEVDAGVV